MKSIKIILLSVMASIIYGVLHDLITANISVEYFTVGHPKIINSQSPFILALVWGIIATWWVGLVMGGLLAIVNQVGNKPTLSIKEIRRLIFRLVLFMFGFSLIAGLVGFTLSNTGVIHLVPVLAEQMDQSIHNRFLAVGWSHGASYLTGIVGTIILSVCITRKRRQKGLSRL